MHTCSILLYANRRSVIIQIPRLFWTIRTYVKNKMFSDDQGRESLQIIPVAGRRMIDRFIKVPWPIYKDDPHWVPPLTFERKWHLSEKNPYFEHADFQAWIAWRGE